MIFNKNKKEVEGRTRDLTKKKRRDLRKKTVHLSPVEAANGQVVRAVFPILPCNMIDNVALFRSSLGLTATNKAKTGTGQKKGKRDGGDRPPLY